MDVLRNMESENDDQMDDIDDYYQSLVRTDRELEELLDISLDNQGESINRIVFIDSKSRDVIPLPPASLVLSESQRVFRDMFTIPDAKLIVVVFHMEFNIRDELIDFDIRIQVPRSQASPSYLAAIGDKQVSITPYYSEDKIWFKIDGVIEYYYDVAKMKFVKGSAGNTGSSSV